VTQWWRCTSAGGESFLVLEVDGRVGSACMPSPVGEQFHEFRETWESMGWRVEKVADARYPKETP
jgi:hypothetical protein